MVKLGEAVPNFELPDTKAENVRLAELRGKPVMIHFWSATCPFVVRYEERLQKITSDYKARGLIVLGIAANDTESDDLIRKVAREHGVNYSVLIDRGHKIADQFGAVTTPHVFLIDSEGKLVYEGSVDDQGWREENPVTKEYVREALDALLRGNSVPNPQTKPFGCTVKRG